MKGAYGSPQLREVIRGLGAASVQSRTSIRTRAAEEVLAMRSS